jgi:broad specificity phosphatase PhoE
LIVTSPFRRTLQTTELGLGWLIKRGVPVQVRGEWQENSDNPCDTGTPIDELAKEFPQFSFDRIFPEFPAKTGRWAFSEKAIVQRGIDCREWLRSRPESVIAVVTHSAFLRLAIQPSRYANADFRVYDFEQDGNKLQQWPLTKNNGGGLGKSPKGEPVVLSEEYGIPDHGGDVNDQDKTVGEPAEQNPR